MELNSKTFLTEQDIKDGTVYNDMKRLIADYERMLSLNRDLVEALHAMYLNFHVITDARNEIEQQYAKEGTKELLIKVKKINAT